MPTKKRKYIFQAENDRRVKQWHFSFNRLLAKTIVITILGGGLLFYSADLLTGMLYKTKLTEIQNNYSDLSSTIINLQNRLNLLNSQIEIIEEKDKAVRTYADLPQIDENIRELGIGGVVLSEKSGIDHLIPKYESAVVILESNIDVLARKVKLELSSYEDIYKKVQENADRIRFIPTIPPIEDGYLNKGFGYRQDPFTKTKRFHYGQDITANIGTPIIAPADGIIESAKHDVGGFGKAIKIIHGSSGYTTFFAHMSKFNVRSGDKVRRGDIIGHSGNTGRSTGPHLHYEVHYHGKPHNPLDYFFSGNMN